MPKRDKDVRSRKAYPFLLEKSKSQESFSVDDLSRIADYSSSTVKTYRSKQWKDLVKTEKGGRLRVLPEFQLLTEEDFCELMSQRRIVFTKYKRLRYSEVLTYEFLLPLTRESLLRKALDDLFYEDSIQRRLREIGLVRVAKWIPTKAGEDEDAYLRRVCTFVSSMFGGYSISHVIGRYLAAPLASRAEAANNDRYIIDETTASVRFIIPIAATKMEETTTAEDPNVYELGLDDATLDAASLVNKDAEQEIGLVRRLFFNLFVMAIVRLVKGEDVIWLIEEAGAYRNLYVFEQAKDSYASR